MVQKQQVLPKATLVDRKDISHDLMVIKLRPPFKMEFKPGQYCTLGLDGIERAYSIASSPHEDNLEIFIELVPAPDGALTPLLWKMKAGDEISIRPRCKGIFTLDEKYQSHLMVATVTGVAPFVSMLRNYLHRGGQGHRFYVLEGASYRNEFTYDLELASMMKAHPETVVFVPTVSRPKDPRNTGWKGETGRVNEVVERYIEKLGLKPESTLVYACGHPGMIEDVKARLTPKGWKVREERFWKQ
ncbi:MAG: ferredoxin--NADP reductase [SAR202 cluster bacterium]|nr:ferredoxin--NADP reductase [SAR202 cluster bacterium]